MSSKKQRYFQGCPISMTKFPAMDQRGQKGSEKKKKQEEEDWKGEEVEGSLWMIIALANCLIHLKCTTCAFLTS